MLCVFLTTLLGFFGACVSQTAPQMTYNNLLNSLGAGSGSGGGGPLDQVNQQASGYCTEREQNAAFSNCMFSFGAQHRRYFSFLASNAPRCRAEVFSCQAADDMMKCLNTQPRTTISDRCWPLMKLVLNKAFRTYNIPCNYDDIETQCGGASKLTQFIPTAQRSSTGQGVNTNPMSMIRQIVNPIIMSIMMATGAFGGGGFGGMFGF